MTLTPMFDVEDLLTGSGPRARRNDPETSHVAADASQLHLHEAKQRVLQVAAALGSCVGSQLNDHYRTMAVTENWRRLAWDSPRKRAGELVTDGYLEITGTRIAEGNNLPESVYEITDKGREAIA